MRGLKIAAIASVSLLLVMVLLVGYLFLTAEVRVTDVAVQGVSAAEDPAAFETLKTRCWRKPSRAPSTKSR